MKNELETSEELNESAKAYFSSLFSERMKIINKYLKDEEGKEKLTSFLNYLEKNINLKLHQERNTDKKSFYKFLEKIFEVRKMLAMKTAYKKMVFEYLALTAPIINDK